jgi:hypothetical protein
LPSERHFNRSVLVGLQARARQVGARLGTEIIRAILPIHQPPRQVNAARDRLAKFRFVRLRVARAFSFFPMFAFFGLTKSCFAVYRLIALVIGGTGPARNTETGP